MKMPRIPNGTLSGFSQKDRVEISQIWHTSLDELPECEPWGMSDDYVTDMQRQSDIEGGAFLWRLAYQCCTKREIQALQRKFEYDETLDEIGAQYSCSRERARQVLHKALRNVRGAVFMTFGADWERYWYD